jgi:hypothetical protein
VIRKTLFELSVYGPYDGKVPLWVTTIDGIVHRLHSQPASMFAPCSMFALCSSHVMEAWMKGQGSDEAKTLTCLSCLGL